MKKETNSVDDFFKKSLQNHKVTPSETARSRFLDAAALAGGKGLTNMLRWYSLLAVVVIITASVFLYSRFSNVDIPASEISDTKSFAENTNNSVENLNPSKHNSQSDKSIADSTAVLIPAKTTGNSPQVAEKSETSSAVFNSPPEISKSNVATGKNKVVETIEPAILHQDEPEFSEAKTNSALTKGFDILQNIAVADTASIVKPENTEIASPTTDPISAGIPPVENQKPLSSVIPNASPFNFNSFISYSLDWNLKNSANYLVHSLNAEGKIQYGRFSFTTGAGITATTAFNDYQVHYNEYLGNYRKLDSITFAYDSKQYNLEPTYYMSDVKIWDSLVNLDSFQVEKRYNQLKVPLLLGYDIVKQGRFVFGFKTGIEMLFYLKSRNLSGDEYNAGMNKLISLNPTADVLTRTNLWFLANLSASCYLSKRIVFEIEPQLRYFLNPEKSGSSPTKQEFIPALRTSLKIKL